MDLDLSGWEGLRASRLVSSAAHAEMVERFSDALCGLRQLETLRMPGTHLVDGHVRRFFSLGGGRLRVLDLSSNPHLTGCLGSGDGHLEVLEVMSIANTGIQLWRTGAPTTLRELGVSGSNFSRDDQDGAGSMDSFVRLVRRAPTLEKLHMTDVDALTDAALTDILRSCPRLEDVSVAGCSSLTPKGLGPLAELSKLVKLDVSRLRQAVTDDNLASVLSRHTLTELRASGADLTPASLDAMLQSKMLHYVDVGIESEQRAASTRMSRRDTYALTRAPLARPPGVVLLRHGRRRALWRGRQPERFADQNSASARERAARALQ